MAATVIRCGSVMRFGPGFFIGVFNAFFGGRLIFVCCLLRFY